MHSLQHVRGPSNSGIAACGSQGKTLTTAWVGDSRGVLGRENEPGVFEAIDLTQVRMPALPRCWLMRGRYACCWLRKE
jgi:hypothetical protein